MPRTLDAERMMGLAHGMSEAELQSNVIKTAGLLGWMVHHTRAVQTITGQHLTPIQGNPGFPDLVMVRHGGLLIVELKSQAGTLDPQQKIWKGYISPEIYRCWQPMDWLMGIIEKELATH